MKKYIYTFIGLNAGNDAVGTTNFGAMMFPCSS